METFQIPLREIRKKFTTSELVLMAWRSQEQHFHFKSKIKTDEVAEKKKGVYGMDDIIPADLPEEFFAKEDIYDKRGNLVARKGEVILSQVTGAQAKQYMAALGIPFPDLGVSKMRDPETAAISDAYGLRR